MRKIDVNSDLGEGFGPYRIADDEAMLGIVSSVNVACGFHAGDPTIMRSTVRAALARGVAVGAHVGFDDRAGFGRREMRLDAGELEALTLYQIGALHAFAAAEGARVMHVTAHGALGNMSFVDADVAGALAGAVKAFDPGLIVVTLPGCEAAKAAEAAGLRVARLFLADRAYDDAGLLVSRKLPGSVIEDVSAIERRVTELLTAGTIATISGGSIAAEVESILVHGDTPGAVEVATAVRRAIGAAGAEIESLAGKPAV